MTLWHTSSDMELAPPPHELDRLLCAAFGRALFHPHQICVCDGQNRPKVKEEGLGDGHSLSRIGSVWLQSPHSHASSRNTTSTLAPRLGVHADAFTRALGMFVSI